MPNQGNKSNGKSGIVQPKKNETMPSKKKENEGKAAKSENTVKQAAGTREEGGSKTPPSEETM